MATCPRSSRIRLDDWKGWGGGPAQFRSLPPDASPDARVGSPRQACNYRKPRAGQANDAAATTTNTRTHTRTSLSRRKTRGPAPVPSLQKFALPVTTVQPSHEARLRPDPKVNLPEAGAVPDRIRDAWRRRDLTRAPKPTNATQGNCPSRL